MKTSYWDFRKYLEKYAEDFLVQMENMYSIAPFERLDKRFKKNKNIQNRRDDAIYKTLWKNFEYGLGEANEAEMLDFSKSIVDDLDLDGDPVGIKDTMDDYWEEQYRFIERLNGYVGKWIRQVRLFKATPMTVSYTHLNAADHSHQSCFARSICAEQAVDTWHQIDTYIINGAFASILLA